MLSLAHDLGHTPFGHAGELALSNCMNSDCFDHNIQSLRILILLEDTYKEHKGLNLSINCLDGLLKHNGPITNEELFSNQLPEIFNYNLNFKSLGSLEAQISSLADDIAYNCHDIDDGLRANLFSIDNLLDLSFINELFENNKNIQKNEIVRNLLNNLATDLIENSMKKIQIKKLKTIDDVYNAKEAIINFSDKVQKGLNEIRNFLKVKMYNHNSVKKWNSKSEMIIEFLFNYFKKNYDKLPNSNSLYSKDRNIADYISGMTDKFALNIYENKN